MKKTITLVTAIIFAAFIANAQAPAPQAAPAQDNPNAPEAVYEKDVIDYGTIEYDADGNREFKFKNTGKEPLIIYSATGSCGCTVPTAPKEPIKAGDTGTIKVHYDTKRVGSFEKTVTVASNGKTASKTLKIKGTVKPATTPAAGTPSVTPAAH
jgi:hypothetical protein